MTSSPRLATNPANAILNYLYALLEAEARLAAATLGLDPGIGVMHVDTPYRDSLACDLMEPVRPDVDAFALDLLRRGPLQRNHFFEQRNGNCRIMADCAAMLSQTTSKWAQLVAPVAEWLTRELGTSQRVKARELPSRLTQSTKRRAKLSDQRPSPVLKSAPNRVCHNCGKERSRDAVYCKSCATEIMSPQRDEAGRMGRKAAHTPEAKRKRSATQRVNALAQHAWQQADQPAWLTRDFYAQNIQPALLAMRSSLIAKTLKVSNSYARGISKGRIAPHPRHWAVLGHLVGCLRSSD